MTLRVTPMTFDNTLISATLQTELYVSQRGEFLEGIPIFKLTKVPLGRPLKASLDVFLACGCRFNMIYPPGNGFLLKNTGVRGALQRELLGDLRVHEEARL